MLVSCLSYEAQPSRGLGFAGDLDPGNPAWAFNVVDDITLLLAHQKPRSLIRGTTQCVRNMVDWLTQEGHRLAPGESH
eukprot:5937115-Amphidinium_carterae.1